MRLGFVPITDGQGGGVYQYSESMRLTLDELLDDELAGDEVVLLLDKGDTIDPPPRSTRTTTAELTLRKARWLPDGRLREAARRVVYRRPGRGAVAGRLATTNAELDARLRGLAIDLMLYPAPRPIAFQTSVPYLVAIHDLQHRLQPEFPEVSANGELEKREFLFSNLIGSATTVLVDSEVGREDVLELYASTGITEDRVQILPFLPAPYLEFGPSIGEAIAAVRRKHSLPARYAFYPAQFWPHKNHARLVTSLGILRADHGIDVPLVLVGSNTGRMRERAHRDVMAAAARLGVADLVHDLGYVPDDDMAGLYAGATVLAFPTFFGPTNIPVIEAWAAGVPVVTSDVRGIREQCGGGGALLADPRAPEDIAAKIAIAWSDTDARAELVRVGTERLHGYTPEDYRRRLAAILEDARSRVTA